MTASRSAAADLRLQEYISLRAESAQARTGQQAILQWSLAALAGLFVAGTLLISQQPTGGFTSNGRLVFLLLFGVTLPGFAFTACLAWCGELIRMERVGIYLRGFEHHLASELKQCGSEREGDKIIGPERKLEIQFEEPLRWETYIHRTTGEGGKSLVGYLGSLGVYVGTIGTAALLFLLLSTSEDLFALWVVVAVAIAHATMLAAIIYTVLKVKRSGAKMSQYGDLKPSETRSASRSYVCEIPSAP